ncbi:MAG: FecR domain-containing protein [Thermoguttaceae bacterium]
MTEKIDREDLSRLILRLSDGLIAPEEHSQLERLLSASAEAREHYAAHLALDNDLSWLCSAARPSSEPILPLDAVAAGQGISQEGRPVGAPPVPGQSRGVSGRRRLKRMVAAIAAAAAIILLATMPWWPWRGSRGSDDLAAARVAGLEGEVQLVSPTGDAQPAAIDEQMLAGQTLRTGPEGALAKLELRDGTRLELGGETTLRLEALAAARSGSGWAAFLSQGRIWADVARQDAEHPAVLKTPHAEVRVLGTKFDAAVSAEATRVQVEEGRVEVVRQADGQHAIVQQGQYMAVGDSHGPVVVSRSPARLEKPRASFGVRVRDVCFAANGESVVTADYGSHIFFWDPATGRKQFDITARDATDVAKLAVTADGGTLAAGSSRPVNGAGQAGVTFWDVRTRRELRTIDVQGRNLRDMALAPDGSRLVTACQDKPNEINVWDVAGGGEPVKLTTRKQVRCVAISPDKRFVAAGTVRGYIHVWTLTNGATVLLAGPGDSTITDLAFSPDGRWLLSSSEKGPVRVQETGTWMEVFRSDEQVRSYRAVAFSFDSKHFAAATDDAAVEIWRVADWQVIAEIRPPERARLAAVAFSSDGKMLAAHRQHGLAMVWDLELK